MSPDPMSPDNVRYIIAILIVAIGLWIVGLGAYMKIKNGVNPVAVGPKGAGWNERMLVAAAIILDGYMLLRAPYPALDRFVFAAPSPLPVLAIALLVLGAVIMVIAQLGMGASWRIGTPQGSNDIEGLVTDGLNQFSRNPIYVGFMIMLAAFVIAAPGPLTLAGFAVSFFGMNKIIEKEEAYLAERFGAAYDAYRKRVRRWL